MCKKYEPICYLEILVVAGVPLVSAFLVFPLARGVLTIIIAAFLVYVILLTISVTLPILFIFFHSRLFSVLVLLLISFALLTALQVA